MHLALFPLKLLFLNMIVLFVLSHGRKMEADSTAKADRARKLQR